MGPRHAGVYGADLVPAARQCAGQALRPAAGRHPHHHDGEEPPHVVRGGAGVPRRIRTVITRRASLPPSQREEKMVQAISIILGGIAATTLAAAALAQEQRLVTEDMMVPSEPGIEIYVRNKRPADMNSFRPERTVLFVHGSTYPAHTGFDLKLGGLSWMDYIAARGYDVYLLDIRGFGKSTRPQEMADKPDANPPLVRGDVALRDINAVVDFIRK